MNVLRGFAEGWLREVLKVDVIEELDSAYGATRQTITHRIPVERRVRVYDPNARKHVWTNALVMDDVTFNALLYADMNLSLLVSPVTNIEKEKVKFKLDMKVTADYDGFLTVSELVAPVMLRSRSPLLGNGKTTSGKLKLLCVNLWNYNHWVGRRHLVVQEIKRLNPDVVAFQEVRRRLISPLETFRSLADDLARELSAYQFAFAPAMSFTERELEYMDEGLAIFSRLPIVDTDVLKLSRDASDRNDFHQRIVQRATVQTKFGRVHILNTHLSLSKRARARTLAEIWRYAAKFKDPVVVMGDMNSELEKEHPEVFDKYGFVDAWREVHSPDEPEEKGWTFNSWEPKKRIDYILLRRKDTRRGAVVVEKISVEGTKWEEQKGVEPVGGVTDMRDRMYPSDHRFIFARIKFNMRRVREEDQQAAESKEQERTSEDGLHIESGDLGVYGMESVQHLHDEL